MNKKQYNNVIDWTLTHDQSAQTEDSLKTARTVFKNMGVALPRGDLKQVSEVLKTDDYMGWRSCTMSEAQAAADRGTAAIGISEEKIVILAANDEEQPVTATASVMTLSDTASASEILGFSFYSYGYGTTNQGGSGSQNSLYFANSNLNVPVGWTGYNQLYGNTDSTIYWTSSDTSVASVSYYSGYITAKNAGIATITARSALGSSDSATFEIWVKGKTPVFLIHGRISNSFGAWGAGNGIFCDPLDTSENNNNHFASSINALSVGNVQVLYTNKGVQDIRGYDLGLPMVVDGVEVTNFTVPAIFNGEFNDGQYSTEHPEGGNLAYFLKTNGYKQNVNLFVFNYPNEDAVIHSAKKFEAYINNLIAHVRSAGTDEMKACFYNSRADYNAGNYKINLVGHSMGGLVSRYYIENLGHDDRVDKLITICTPHWGSGYAETSCLTGLFHKLCDHDLRFNSNMYGGSLSQNLSCVDVDSLCLSNWNYTLTDELQYSKSRNTKYYGIAGIEYDATPIEDDNYFFEIPTTLSTYQQLVDYMTGKCVYKLTLFNTIDPVDVKGVGDNMVGFLSQIGWKENDGESPNKRIQMEKIFVDVDTVGDHLTAIPGLEALDMLHSKIQHRTRIMKQVYNYLQE